MSGTAPEPKAPRLRASRWMWIVLIASLAFNLLGIGLVAGSLWQVRYARATPGGPLPGRIADFAETLPAERRAGIQDAMNAAQAAIKPLRQQARQARREALKAFTSEPFDKDKFAAAQARASAASLEVRQAYLRLLTEMGASLSAEERRQFLRWRAHQPPRRRWWHEEGREEVPGKGGISAERRR
jgi:uncharacterized membrane protein